MRVKKSAIVVGVIFLASTVGLFYKSKYIDNRSEVVTDTATFKNLTVIDTITPEVVNTQKVEQRIVAEPSLIKEVQPIVEKQKEKIAVVKKQSKKVSKPQKSKVVKDDVSKDERNDVIPNF